MHGRGLIHAVTQVVKMGLSAGEPISRFAYRRRNTVFVLGSRLSRYIK